VLLRGLRVRKGLNQTEYAKMIDTTQANLSSMENRQRAERCGGQSDFSKALLKSVEPVLIR